MKKCPKCGTILDDSKKKCYMCGTELLDNKTNFNNFDNDIGASVSKGQDNVFNNGEDIAFKGKDLVRKNNNNVFFSQNSNSQNTFGNEIDKLNSMSYDNRSNFKKGFDNIFNNKDFKSKDEINGRRVTYSTNPNIPKDMRKAMEASEKEKRKNKKNSETPNDNAEANVKTFKASSLRKEVEPEQPAPKKSFFAKQQEPKEERNSGLFAKFPFLNDNNNQNNQSNNFNNNNFMNNNQSYGNNQNYGNQSYDDNQNYNVNNNPNVNFNTNYSQNNIQGYNQNYNQNYSNQGYNNGNNQNNRQSKYDFGFVNDERDYISQEEQKENINRFQNVTKQLNKNKAKAKPKKVTGYKDNSYKGDGKQMIVNLVCIIVFVGILIFVYNNFLKPKDGDDLAGLTYTLDKSFVLHSKDAFGRYYTYDNNCSLRISYGATNDATGFVDNYLNNIADTYKRDDKATVQYDELKINDNLWTAMSILYFPTDLDTIGGVAPLPRYKYTAILNKGNFYSIIFVNAKEDATCSEKYEAFVETLDFISDNS